MSKRILVLEDEASIREIIGACIQDLCGWIPILAESGNVALEIVRRQPLDMILLDISMPNMDGFQFFQLMQQQSPDQAIPVVLLTAKVLPRDRDRFKAMGIQGVIPKPFNPATLCQEIKTLMQW